MYLNLALNKIMFKFIYFFINIYMLRCTIYSILVNNLEIQITPIVSNHFSYNKHYAISWTCRVKMSILHIKYGKMTVFVTLYMNQCTRFCNCISEHEDSGKSAHKRRLARAFTARIHKEWM